MFALFDKYIDEAMKIKGNIQYESDYINPIHILNTILGILALGSHLKNIKVTNQCKFLMICLERVKTEKSL